MTLTSTGGVSEKSLHSGELFAGPGAWGVSARITDPLFFDSGDPGLYPLMVAVYLAPSDIALAALAIEESSTS